MKPVSFVTGGTGFIGQYLVKRLIEEGHEVRILARKPEKAHALFNGSAKIIEGDILDTGALERGASGAHYIFHLAARVGDYGPVKEFSRINVTGTEKLLDAAEKTGNVRLIYVSTNAVVGVKRKNITTEETPYADTGGPYGITKGLAERAILGRHGNNGFQAVVVRPPLVYGPGSPNWVLRPLDLMKAGKMILVNRGSGRCWHLYVENLIDALMLAAKSEKASGEIFIVSDGEDTSWKRYFSLLAESAGLPPAQKNLSTGLANVLAWSMYLMNKLTGMKPKLTPLGVGILTSEKGVSIDKARSVLGYGPVVNLEEGMRRVGNWLRQEGLV